MFTYLSHDLTWRTLREGYIFVGFCVFVFVIALFYFASTVYSAWHIVSALFLFVEHNRAQLRLL